MFQRLILIFYHGGTSPTKSLGRYLSSNLTAQLESSVTFCISVEVSLKPFFSAEKP